jgi:uncharacterized membrane protein
MHINRVVISLALVVSFTVSAPLEGFGLGFLSRYETVKDSNGEVRLDLKEISDGKVRYYRYESSGKTIKFFVVKSPDGVIRAAFDACDVCFPEKKGYSQDGDFMVCGNCGRKFHSNRVNIVEGGCNPAPLRRVQQGQQLVIKVADILPGGRLF